MNVFNILHATLKSLKHLNKEENDRKDNELGWFRMAAFVDFSHIVNLEISREISLIHSSRKFQPQIAQYCLCISLFF